MGEDVVITIGANAASAAGAISGFQSSSAASFALIGQQVDRVIGQFSQMAGAISDKLGGTTTTFADFDQAMANVRSIAQGTNSDFADMTAQAREIASTLPTSSKAVAEGFFQLASAGLDAQDIMAVTPAIMDLSVASASDFETAANGVTAALFTYGRPLSDVNELTEVFQNTNVKFKTTMPELAESMKFAGAQAATMGVSFEETAAAIGIARNAGLDASQAGTALRTVLSSLAKPTTQAQEAMANYGFELAQNADGSLNLEDTFGSLQDSVIGIQDPIERAAALESIFGKRGVALASALATNSDGFNALADSLTTEGTVATAVEIQNQGLGNQMEILSGSIEDQQAILGEKLAPATLLATEAKLKMLDAVNKLPGPFVKWGGGALLVAADLGKLLFPVIQMVLQTGLLFASMSAQSAATAAATGTTVAHTGATTTYTIAQTAANLALLLFPAVLIIGAILALIGVIFLMVKNWDKVTATLKFVWKWIKKNADMILLFVAIAVPFIGLPLLIIKNWDKVVEFLSAAWTFLIDALKAYVDFYIEAWTFVIEKTIEFVQAIFGAVETAWNAVVDFTVGILDRFVSIISSTWDSIIGLVTSAGENLVSGFMSAVTGITDAVQGVKDTILGAITDLISSAAKWGSDMIGEFVSGVTSSIPSIGSAVSGIASTITSWIGFDEKKNDDMAARWGTDLGSIFAQGIGSSVGEVALASQGLVGAVSGSPGGGDGGLGGANGPVFQISAGAIVISGSATEEDGRRVMAGLRAEAIRTGVFPSRS